MVNLQAGNGQPHDLGSPSLLMSDNQLTHPPLAAFGREGAQLAGLPGATETAGIPSHPFTAIQLETGVPTPYKPAFRELFPFCSCCKNEIKSP